MAPGPTMPTAIGSWARKKQPCTARRARTLSLWLMRMVMLYSLQPWAIDLPPHQLRGHAAGAQVRLLVRRLSSRARQAMCLPGLLLGHCLFCHLQRACHMTLWRARCQACRAVHQPCAAAACPPCTGCDSTAGCQALCQGQSCLPTLCSSRLGGFVLGLGFRV